MFSHFRSHLGLLVLNKVPENRKSILLEISDADSLIYLGQTLSQILSLIVVLNL